MGASVRPTQPDSDLASLLPEVADSARSLMSAAQQAGVKITPIETRRSQDRQNALYAQGRTAPGNVVTWTLHSNHTPGAAVDFLVNGDQSGTDPGYQWLQQEAPKHGFGVLGSKDPGHVEMPSALPHSTGTGPPPPPASQPVQPPNVEMELAKLANDAMQNGADPHDTTAKLHDMISYLRAFPKMAEHATNALADGVASPADITRTLYPHAQGYATAQRSSVQPTDAEAANLPPDPMGAGGKIAANVANVAQGIPGAEAAEAGVRSVVRRQPYRQAYNDIENATKQIPTALRVGERIAGGAPLAAVLPGSAAVSGALIGGADQALSADPDMSLKERGLRTVAGAAGGAVLGKAGERVVTGAKALLPGALGGVGEGADAALIRMRGEQASSAKRLFDRALAEGHAGEVSPAIHSFLAEPDIAPIVERIQSGRTGSQMETPELLDRVYKELSDMQKQATKSLGALDPSKPNTAISRLADIKAAKQKFLRVVSSPTQKPPLTMDVAPETFDTDPNIIPGREALSGPQTTTTAPAVTTAQSPVKSLREALQDFHARPGIVAQRAEGTVQQRMARQALERHGAESDVTAVSGPMRGAPPPERSVTSTAFQMPQRAEQMVSPGVHIETPGMRVQTAPAEDVPALMPSYEDAVQDFAKRAKEIDALKRGYTTLKQKGTGDVPPTSALGRKTPLSLQEWAKTATPEQIEAARRGVLGLVRDATALGGKTLAKGRQYNAAAAPILRKLPSDSQDLTEVLQNLGLLTTGNAVARP